MKNTVLYLKRMVTFDILRPLGLNLKSINIIEQFQFEFLLRQHC